jgi:hypothetical protein
VDQSPLFFMVQFSVAPGQRAAAFFAVLQRHLFMGMPQSMKRHVASFVDHVSSFTKTFALIKFHFLTSKNANKKLVYIP